MRTALITGASRGLGRSIALELASRGGYHLILNYRSNKDEANKVLDAVKEKGVEAELLQFDVSNRVEVQKSISNWFDKNDKPIEILVNNAGINNDQLLAFMDYEAWQSVIDTSLNGFFNVTKEVLPKLVRNKWGRIVNMVSVSGMKGVAGQTNYSAAKGGVVAATRSLAQEIARKGITVNAVAPGFIKTDMTKDLPEKELKMMIPMRRFGEAEEVAKAVAFLVSDDASYITGEVLNINGGIHGG